MCLLKAIILIVIECTAFGATQNHSHTVTESSVPTVSIYQNILLNQTQVLNNCKKENIDTQTKFLCSEYMTMAGLVSDKKIVITPQNISDVLSTKINITEFCKKLINNTEFGISAPTTKFFTALQEQSQCFLGCSKFGNVQVNQMCKIIMYGYEKILNSKSINESSIQKENLKPVQRLSMVPPLNTNKTQLNEGNKTSALSADNLPKNSEPEKVTTTTTTPQQVTPKNKEEKKSQDKGIPIEIQPIDLLQLIKTTVPKQTAPDISKLGVYLNATKTEGIKPAPVNLTPEAFPQQTDAPKVPVKLSDVPVINADASTNQQLPPNSEVMDANSTEEDVNLITKLSPNDFGDDDPNQSQENYPGEGNDGDGVDGVNEEIPEINKNNNNNFPEEQKYQPAADKVRIDPFVADADSNFFTYFMFLMLICIMAYVAYHNKSKVMALVLEGRRSSGGRNGIGRRKHTAAYRKLDTNLEEAISSNSSVRTTQIIY